MSAATRFAELKAAAYAANMAIVEAGLVLLTWGNASVADHSAGVCAIKPSGVAYDELNPDAMVVVAISDGRKLDGALLPSSDTATHLEIYRSFTAVGSVVHTHSHYAVCFAQAQATIPCHGTTHADHFFGPIPCTRTMTAAEVADDYELNTGRVIVETFTSATPAIDPMDVPAVVVANHGPFAWGTTGPQAVENAIVMEEVARMALHTWAINPHAGQAPEYLVSKHFLRKHGANAYYGQKSR